MLGCERHVSHPISRGHGGCPWYPFSAANRVGIPERCCGVQKVGHEGRSWTRLCYARKGFPSWSGALYNTPLGTQVSPKWTPPGEPFPLLTTLSRTTSPEPGRQITPSWFPRCSMKHRIQRRISIINRQTLSGNNTAPDQTRDSNRTLEVFRKHPHFRVQEVLGSFSRDFLPYNPPSAVRGRLRVAKA
jgi:hypothetical protein